MPLACRILLYVLLSAFGAASALKAQEAASPDGSIRVKAETGTLLRLTLNVDGRAVVRIDSILLDLEPRSGRNLSAILLKQTVESIHDTIIPTVREKRGRILDHYNQLRLELKGGWSLSVRVFDDAVAYRFETALPESITVAGEHAVFAFSPEDSAWASVVEPRDSVDRFHTSYENQYTDTSIASLPPNQPIVLPLVVKVKGGPCLGITESDLLDYPGMYLAGTGGPSLRAVFPRYPLESRVFGGEFKQALVTRRASFIARTWGMRTFPWRVLAVARRDVQLIENDVVYRLASPLTPGDARWIKPGHAFDEWIFNHALYGVDFPAGLNTATYKYYADFAARFRVDYIMLDAGWSDPNDLHKLTPAMDVPGIIRYARSKGVGVILWADALALDQSLEESLDRFARWGARGVLVDFMDRDDQPMVNFYERVARAAARRKLLVSFHGAFKPTGLQRMLPNNITREAVLGHEYNKWSDKVTPPYTATIPFVRMLAGPMDFEGGSMKNLPKADFHPMFDDPASQGTRVHELATYVVFESPIQYLAGNPSDYLREPEYTDFLTSIPPVWDETVGIDGQIGKYVAVARRSGKDWYIGVMNDWAARDLSLPLNFLGTGTYTALVYEDGINAHLNGRDYRTRETRLKKGERLKVHLAPGGGFVARLRP